jgi:NADPH:quinone reductase-like Zn-dependent oxidoreductase
MKAIYLIKNGKSEIAFEQRETPMPVLHDNSVLIQVEGFGLNYADVMARLGLYDDCPPLPAILGYDVVGRIHQVGKKVSGFQIGDRVLALTRFGGYAEYAVADARVISKIGDNVDIAHATGLATQYTTAYYCAYEAVNLFAGDWALVHAAAGGVGNGIAQLCLRKGVNIIATAGSEDKIQLLRSMGIDKVINYRKEDYVEKIKEWGLHKKIDAVFDSIAGDNVGKGFKMLNAGGRLVMYGASKLSESTNKLVVLKNALQFGIYHPAEFMMSSKSILGVNMLRIADNKPEIIQRCMNEIVKLYDEKQIQPLPGKVYPLSALAQAHNDLENRITMGKMAIRWE